MSLKIAYILKMYPRFSETFIVNEILELERQGVDVRIYSLRKPDDGRFHPALARVKANVIYAPQYPQMEPERVQAAHAALQDAVPVRYAAARQKAVDRGEDYALKRFLQAGVIAEHLRRNPVDALHAHFGSSATRVASIVTKLTGIPYSFTAHAKDIFHEAVTASSLQRKISGARFVVTVSRYNERYLEKLRGDQPGDVRALYNGIDLDHFQPDPAVHRQDNLILGVGRLVEKKGFDILIDACAILQRRGIDFRCEIIGKGDLQAPLAAQIAALGLEDRVRLAGPRPQDQVRAAYQQAALFALPCRIGSDGNRDGLPTVLLEAMACGLPAVTTPVTGNPEIVDDGVNGRLVPENDPAALADALAALLTDPARRLRMSAAARAKVEFAFDVRRNVARLHSWLAETVIPAPEPLFAEAETIPAPVPSLPAPPALAEVVLPS